MRLKTRLQISFIATVVGPIVLLVILVVGFSRMRIAALEKEYGVDFSLGYLVNTVQEMNQSTSEVWEKMNRQAEEDPDRFLKYSYLQELDAELESRFSFLLLMKDGEVYYHAKENDIDYLIRYLPAYGDGDDEREKTGVYLGDRKKAMVKQVDLKFSDGTVGSAFIVTAAASMVPQIWVLLAELGLLMLGVLAITGLIMTLWIYNGINKPIQKLQEATRRIGEGDLDFSIEAEGKDEIAELTRDFEAMRQRLAQSEEEKRRYDKESRELISNISHDLKTPVTAVKGYVEGIMDGVADTPEKMDRYIRTIYRKANEIDRLINELTFYSKIDTNRVPYHFTTLNVYEYFNDCAEELEPELEALGISFEYEYLADRSTIIIADPEQLMRVISNIVSNSIKYLDKSNGEICLRVLDVGDYIQVEMEDNGRGIEAKDLAAIFDRFYRTDESRSSSTGGSGIGLSIVQKIIEDHDGKIWASSQPGHGTTMHFVIRKYQETAGQDAENSGTENTSYEPEKDTDH